MKILIIDNYDSFTYNLVQAVEEILENTIDLVKNDNIDYEKVTQYDGIILSPGSGIPSEAGDLIKVIQAYGDKIPMLGVCLGHQGIVEAFGGKLLQLNEVFHGIGSTIKVLETHEIYKDLEKPITVGRYHSWAVEKNTLPDNFVITAVDENDIIMSYKHKSLPLTGVQFHPESILTPNGKKILNNWINSIK